MADKVKSPRNITSPRLALENVSRTQPTQEEESASLYKPMPVCVTAPDGKASTYNDITTGHTAHMVRLRACEEFSLPVEATKLYWGKELLIDPLSFNDFSFLSKREPGTLQFTIVIDDTLTTSAK